MREIDVIFRREIGRVTVDARIFSDPSPDYSYMGEFSGFAADPVTICYDRETGNAWDGAHWRDSRGRFAPEPDDYDEGSEYRFITEGACQYLPGQKDWYRYCFENCQRLDRLDHDWEYVGVAVDVLIDGREVGSASVWGIEYDWRKADREYCASYAKELTAEAIDEARRFAHLLRECVA